MSEVSKWSINSFVWLISPQNIKLENTTYVFGDGKEENEKLRPTQNKEKHSEILIICEHKHK